MMTFDLAAILKEQAASGAPWVPFLDFSSLTVGVYVVRGSDEATHQPHTRDEVYYALGGSGVLHCEGGARPIREGTVAFVPAGAAHHFVADEGELRLLAFFSSAPPTMRVEVIPCTQ
jgi:mannose-6-phosphate isomerase-like protein (cupin superfamily)